MTQQTLALKTVNLFRRLAKLWEPPTKLTVSEWADNNRILQSSTASEPGPWRTDRVPYLREIMDCLSAQSPVKYVSFEKSAQVGGSESGNNWIGYVMDHEPGPMMMVQPSVDLAKTYSKRNIAPLITSTQALRHKIKDSRSRDSGNTTLVKEFSGGLLVMTGANSAAGLRSMPVRYLFLDEVDAYPADVEGEGDPLDLAIARTRTFNRRKVLKVSTPTISGQSRIEKDYLESDQRKYFVPCPECGHMHVLEWANFIIPKDSEGTKHPEKAHMVCPECGSIIEEYHKTEMLAAGEWRPTCAEKIDKYRRGYHISTLYAPLGFYSWKEIAEQWLAINKDQGRLKTFINTVLGQTWGEDTEVIDYEMLYENRRTYYEADLPDDVLILTAAVDTQDDRLEYECVGWGKNKQSWGIEYGVILGDPRQPAVWKSLDLWLTKQWRYADGVALGIACACVDSGGHATSEVYSFCKQREYRRIYAIKGRGGAGLPLVGRASRSNRMKVPLFTLGVDTGKETVVSRLKVEDEDMPGRCFYPTKEDGTPVKGYDLAYFKNLTSERRQLKYKNGKPRYEWIKPSGARNEPLDLRNYATAAFEILSLDMEALAAVPRAKIARIQKPAAAKRRRVLSPGIG
ncbi:MAG: phage terminase large subunit family protein [Veillonellales bacterium]